jgi:PAS domain S-box-containing protein
MDILPKNVIERTLPPLKYEDVAEISAEPWILPLPKLSNQITMPKLDDDTRPIVITDTKNPFHIVAVNKAWEDLCGYTREECQGKSLGQLLQGPETEMSDASIMLSKLLGGVEANTILTNYAKNGRKFKNHIRVGPIVDEMGKTVNFIGILREVNDTDGEFSELRIDGERMQLPFMS